MVRCLEWTGVLLARFVAFPGCDGQVRCVARLSSFSHPGRQFDFQPPGLDWAGRWLLVGDLTGAGRPSLGGFQLRQARDQVF